MVPSPAMLVPWDNMAEMPILTPHLRVCRVSHPYSNATSLALRGRETEFSAGFLRTCPHPPGLSQAQRGVSGWVSQRGATATASLSLFHS